jgi:hypothetical protein
MTTEGAIANTQDIGRLYLLECRGYFPPGYALKSALTVMRYCKQIIELKEKYSRTPYPGPVITDG